MSKPYFTSLHSYTDYEVIKPKFAPTVKISPQKDTCNVKYEEF